MNVIALTRPTERQIENLKAQLKVSGIPHSVKIMNSIKRSAGSVAVRPTKSTGYHWTPEQVLKVIAIMRSCGLYVKDYDNYGRNNNDLVYSDGLSYIMAIV